jgi:bacillithiol system protein YtxJ
LPITLITMQQLTTPEQYDLLIATGEDVILFKHSGRCSISGGACKEVSIAIDELQIENIYMLDVLNTGDLKHYVADQTEIKHESPQVLIYI